MDALKLDTLKEIVNMCTARAAHACSELFGRKVMIDVPEAKILPLQEVPEYLGGPELKIAGTYFNMYGDATGKILLMLDHNSAINIADRLTSAVQYINISSKKEDIEELKISSLKEFGNIVVNSYINALAEILEMELSPSVPFYASDMLGAVIDFLLIEISQNSYKALILKTCIKIYNKNIDAHFILFADDVLLNKIFEKLHI